MNCLQSDVNEHSAEIFWRDGAVKLANFVHRGTISIFYRPVEWALSQSRDYFGRLRCWEKNAFFARFCSDRCSAALAAKLLRTTKLNLLYDQVFVREPASNLATPWHTDQPYWLIEGRRVLSIYVALDRVTADTGLLEFVASSHRWDRTFAAFPCGEDGQRISESGGRRNYGEEPLPDIESTRGSYRIIGWELEPGDALAFHGRVIHGATANTHPSARRRGYVMRLCGDDVFYFDRPGVNALLRNPRLRNGDPLDSDQYPVVFRSGAGSLRPVSRNAMSAFG